MSDKNKDIDSYLRRQRLRKVLVYVSALIIFVGFMSFALYMEHG